MRTTLPLLAALLLGAAPAAATAAPQGPALGSPARPLRVVLIPADGGTEDGTKADYQPVFNAVSRMTGLAFDLKVAQSYGAVVEAMCARTADIAFFGPVTYVQAHDRGCAQLLAVAVEKGQSIYYAGVFAKAGAHIDSLADLKGKRVAFGDLNSTSSFVFPVAMMMGAHLDPARDFKAVRLTGSHANSLAALTEGQVDAAALSFDSFDKAIAQGAVDPRAIRVVARSGPIPYPPLAMNTRLPEPMKARLKQAFAGVAKAPGVTPDMIRGYGGGKVDRYDAAFPEDRFRVAALEMARVTDQAKGEILKAAARR
jgi:phosphonate transport system substrate-binding protein